MATPILTPRLTLTPFDASSPEDLEFILRLLNEPSFLANIGDRNVRDVDGAKRYLENGPLKSYAEHGAGLMRVTVSETGEHVGMCGLVFRDTLPAPDIGFAFLPEHWGKGYATESASSAIEHAKEHQGITQIMGITSPGNAGSIHVLEKLGLKLIETKALPPRKEILKIFSKDLTL